MNILSDAWGQVGEPALGHLLLLHACCYATDHLPRLGGGGGGRSNELTPSGFYGGNLCLVKLVAG